MNPLHDIILVDLSDQETGTGEKMDVHRRGLMHRAFSVLIYNTSGEMLLQRRALTKYHSPGLWTNACCSHPRPGESVEAAASRRLGEELGFHCELNYKGFFHYIAPFDNGLTENEVDHIFTGIYEGPLTPDPSEVHETRWITTSELNYWMATQPEEFTVWFREIMNQIDSSSFNCC